jgi:hypothetical protein
MINQWNISLRSKHIVQVEHAGLSGLVVILVDKKEIFRTNLPRGENLDHQFSIEGKPCTLRILYELKRIGNIGQSENWHYEFLLDGVKQEFAPKDSAPTNETKKNWWEFWK